MEFKILQTYDDKYEIEKLRCEVLHFSEMGTFYINELTEGREFVMAAKENGTFIGGCYFHRFDNVLMIDQLFVKEEYQNSGKQVGRAILKEMLSSKEELENLLGGKLDLCRIQSNNEKASYIYNQVGFIEKANDEDTFFRKI